MCFYLGHEVLDHLLRTLVAGVADGAQQSVVAKLFVLGVLGFVEAVGIDEEGSLPDAVDTLADELESRPQAYGGIGLHMEE